MKIIQIKEGSIKKSDKKLGQYKLKEKVFELRGLESCEWIRVTIYARFLTIGE